MQYINLKFKNKAVRKNTKQYRYYEATSCFLRLEFLSAGILYITVHKIKSGKAIGIWVLCWKYNCYIYLHKENRIWTRGLCVLCFILKVYFSYTYYTLSDKSDYSAYAKNGLWKRYALQWWNLSKERTVEKNKMVPMLKLQIQHQETYERASFSKETEWPPTPTECEPAWSSVPLKR